MNITPEDDKIIRLLIKIIKNREIAPRCVLMPEFTAVFTMMRDKYEDQGGTNAIREHYKNFQ